MLNRYWSVMQQIFKAKRCHDIDIMTSYHPVIEMHFVILRSWFLRYTCIMGTATYYMVFQTYHCSSNILSSVFQHHYIKCITYLTSTYLWDYPYSHLLSCTIPQAFRHHWQWRFLLGLINRCFSTDIHGSF